ncbi:hypothetical protein FYM80_005123, partial [Escherichia coli]|nr:hypothetical protein [Escherichia coli]
MTGYNKGWPVTLPAVAVYLTDASAADEFVDEGTWEATLHIEVFLRAKEPD